MQRSGQEGVYSNMETKTKQQLKEEQLAKALRDNLRRRKAQDNDKNQNKEK